MDEAHVISGERLRSLTRMAKLWWAGWIVAVAALLGAAWAWGHAAGGAAAYDRAISDVHLMSDNVDRLRANGEAMLTDLKTFEQHQDVEANAIIEAGAYLKKRQQQELYNMTAVIDLTKAQARKKK